jgi:protease-4
MGARVSTRARRSSCAWHGRIVAGLVAATLGVAHPHAASGSPNEGEPRPITRDADRVYTTVAGEADGAATVTNPANLGFLRGFNGVVDLSWTKPSALRRGSGVGLLLGLPLPLQIASLGLGYQFLDPYTPGQDTGGTDQPQNPDDRYSKLTFALALPMKRWITRWFRGAPKALRNISLGLSYSRLVSSQNFHAAGTNSVDLALAWWLSRFLAFGFVARSINVPQTGPSPKVTQSYVLDPELALRPLGTNTLEVAIGTRWAPAVPGDARWRTHYFDPRGRLLLSFGGVRLFAEAERFSFFPTGLADSAVKDGVRMTAGFGLDFGHFGFLGGVTPSAGGSSNFGIDGGVARIRVSSERYESVVNVRPRLVTKIALRKYAGDRGLWQLIRHLDEIGERGGVALLETEGIALGYPQLEEVREALLRVQRRGGRVVTYMHGGGLRSYFVAALSDRIIAHPNAGLELLGMRIQSFYFADLLAKLGVKAEFVRVAQYKGVPDVWQRTTASDPVARQRKMFFTDVWNHVLRTSARDRGQDPLVVKEWIDQAPLDAPDALREGVIDELSFPDEVDARLERWLGRTVRVEEPDRQREHANTFGPQQRIAVLTIEGDLLDGDSFTIPLLGRKIAGAATLTKQIAALRNDDSVRAVVVRIDSPGGSVRAADDIARELDLTRKRKPVVISMGNTCASGGYYIATAGQYVFADATTATGSIGIFYPKFDLSGLADKLGIGIDQFDFGEHAGLRSWWKPYSEGEREAAQRDIEEGYREFTARVAKARNMTPEQVDAAARGRVWSGVRAIEVGLVDDYGGLREAVMRARAIVQLGPDEGDVVLYPEPPTPLQNLRAILGLKVPNPLGRDVAVRGLGQVALGWALPRPVTQVLALLPVSLWYGERPGAMALSEETFSIED